MTHGEPGMIDICLANNAPIRPNVAERYLEEDAVPLVVDREAIAALGVELVEAPVATRKGKYARHDPDALAREVLNIYRRQVVRIFRGTRRYILEE